MKKELKKEEVDKLPEAIKDFCKEEDGKWFFEAESSGDVSGLKSALRKEKESVKELKAQLKDFEGMDAEEVRETLDKVKKGELGKPANQEEIDRLIARAKKEERLAAKTEHDKVLTGLNTELSRLKLSGPVKDAALKAGVLPRLVDDVMQVNANRFRLNDQGKIEVLDGDGDPTGKSLEDFWSKDYKSERPEYFAASGAGGSGAPSGSNGSRSGGRTIPLAEWQKMTAAESTQFFKDGGQVAP